MDGGDSLDPKVDLNERINKNGKIYLQNLALTQTCSVDSKDNICFNPDVPLNAFKKDFFRGIRQGFPRCQDPGERADGLFDAGN